MKPYVFTIKKRIVQHAHKTIHFQEGPLDMKSKRTNHNGVIKQRRRNKEAKLTGISLKKLNLF